MKKIKRKLIAVPVLLLAMVMMSCGGNAKDSSAESTDEGATLSISENFNPTGLPIVKEKITFRIMVAQTPTSKKPTAEKAIFQKLAEETNVEIIWEEVPQTAWGEKVNLAISTGDLPDAIIGGQVGPIADAIEAGYVVSLDEYMEYLPSLQNIYDTYPITEKAATYIPDGKHYYYPSLESKDFASLRAALFINQEWLDALNLPMPTTTEELYTTLKAFKENDPNGNGIADEIPLAANDAFFGFSLLDMMGPWGIMGARNPVHTTVRDGKLDFNPVNDNYRQALEFFHRLYSEGLIEQDSIIMKENVKQAKIAAQPAVYGASIEWSVDNFVLNKDQYAVVPPLTGPNGDRKWTFNDTEQVKHGMVVFNTCEAPEVLLRWMDEAQTGLNAIMGFAGERGYIWEADDETKTWWSRDEELEAEGQSEATLRPTEGVQNGFATPGASGYTRIYGETSSAAEKQKLTDLYADAFFEEYYPASIPIFPATMESKEISLLESELEVYIEAFFADAIINGIDDKKWETHLNQCDALQYKALVDFYQERYDQIKVQ